MPSAANVLSSRWAPAFLAAALLLPFLGTASFFDDPFEKRMARWTAAHPDRPYSYPLDTPGLQKVNWEPGGRPETQHPFLPPLLLGSWGRLAGEGGEQARLWFLLLAAGSACLMAGLASFYTKRTLFAAALLLLSPVFWVNHIHLYGDNTFFFFLLLAAYLYHRWRAAPSWSGAAWAGAAWAAACLCRYHALLLAPIWALDVLRARPRGERTVAGLYVAAAAILGGWTAYEVSVYGASHLLLSFGIRAGSFEGNLFFLPWVFTGGAVGPAAWLAAAACGARRAALAGLAAGALGLWLLSPAGGFSPFEAAQASLWFFVAAAAAAAWAGEARKDGRNLWFLNLWGGLAAVFIQLYLTRTAARHLYLFLPVLVIWTVRALESRGFFDKPFRAGAALAAAGLLSLSVAVADARQASVNRDVAPRAASLAAGAPRYYWGNDFMGYAEYLRADGWLPWDPSQSPPPGSVLLVPTFYNTAGFIGLPPGWQPAGELRFPSRWPVRVLAPHRSAGFHSSSWGALPFAFASGDMEVFRLYRLPEGRQPPAAK